MNLIFKELDAAEKKTIDDGYKQVREKHGVPESAEIPLSFAVYEGEEMMGGVAGRIYDGWLYISDLWVTPKQRGAGLGRKLMAAIEEKAKEHGIQNSFLWTASYEAPSFYKKCGYELGLKLEDKPKGHDRLVFRKKI